VQGTLEGLPLGGDEFKWAALSQALTGWRGRVALKAHSLILLYDQLALDL
jgi:hypothetical protein